MGGLTPEPVASLPLPLESKKSMRFIVLYFMSLTLLSLGTAEACRQAFLFLKPAVGSVLSGAGEGGPPGPDAGAAALGPPTGRPVCDEEQTCPRRALHGSVLRTGQVLNSGSVLKQNMESKRNAPWWIERQPVG